MPYHFVIAVFNSFYFDMVDSEPLNVTEASQGLTVGDIAGITLGIFIPLIIATIIVIVLIKRKKSNDANGKTELKQYSLE